MANEVGRPRCIVCQEPLPKSSLGAAVTKKISRGDVERASAKPDRVLGRDNEMRFSADDVLKARTFLDDEDGPDAAASVGAGSDEAVSPGETPPPEGSGPGTITTLTPEVPPVVPTAGAIAWIACAPLPPIPLTPGRRVNVGRADSSDLVLPHTEVSRTHVIFSVDTSTITLEDQGSANGCYVNDRRATREEVKVGDEIRIGPYRLEIRPDAQPSLAGIGGETRSFMMSPSTPDASMSGKLSKIPLTEILQSIEFNQKTCTIIIAAGGLEGRIVFAAGKPQHATFGAERDVAAVRALLRLKEGRFLLTSTIAPAEATMNATVTALLLDASREADEGQRSA
jgi:hypothetical protein